ncbi:MAG: hypothetical protein JSU70_16060 [Phycisphaerales bacterium]|nr:MAG: hypothetical protein JSU70_16060 [Phycisphaerales bacterium]
MTTLGKVFGFATGVLVCLLLSATGCTDLSEGEAKQDIQTQEKQTVVAPAADKVVEPKEEPQVAARAEVEVPQPPPPEVEPVTAVKPEVKAEEATKPVVEPEQKAVAKPAEKVKAEPQGPAVQLALKFKQGDSTKYRVMTEAQKSVQWEGPLPKKPAAFKGGHTGNRVEMTFTQQIQSVKDDGSAVAKITIDGLKYVGRVRDNIVLEFDSSKPKDPNYPLAKLIGQSYTIELSPRGQVAKIVDVNDARTAVRGGSSGHKTASTLLSADVIRQRHNISALMLAKKSEFRTGESWSGVRSFSFGMMGSKTFERVYTLKDVKEEGDRRVAIVEMSAVPSSKMAEEIHKEQGSGFFSKMFDSTETYNGQLELDIASGTVEKYIEQLQTEWVAAEPAPEGDAQGPAALRMAAIRLYQIEKID